MREIKKIVAHNQTTTTKTLSEDKLPTIERPFVCRKLSKPQCRATKPKATRSVAATMIHQQPVLP